MRRLQGGAGKSKGELATQTTAGNWPTSPFFPRTCDRPDSARDPRGQRGRASHPGCQGPGTGLPRQLGPHPFSGQIENPVRVGQSTRQEKRCNLPTPPTKPTKPPIGRPLLRPPIAEWVLRSGRFDPRGSGTCGHLKDSRDGDSGGRSKRERKWAERRSKLVFTCLRWDVDLGFIRAGYDR